MSSTVSRVSPPKVASRSNSRRKVGLNLDLNVPPSDIGDEVGTSSHVPAVAQVQTSQQQYVPQVVPIDVDSFDDDVVLSSPMTFAEAKNNSRRNRTRRNVVDVDLEASRNAKRQRIPINQPIINCESYVASQTLNNVGGIRKGFPEQTTKMAPRPPPPPPEPTFNCPVCMGPLIEEMTTKCGHIFCKACIKKSISSQGKCPTCRRKITMKDTIRIYLPATS